jgi:2-polyprenyl-3-methyl-5-hydroxy-6-metoxy-1,4-benzoquinol methylase
MPGEQDYYYSDQQRGIDRRTKALVVRRCLPFIKGAAVLDLGYVDGCWTDEILRLGYSSDIVEGNSKHIEYARAAYAGNAMVRIQQSSFEEFAPARQYNTIIAGDMLQYVEDSIGFLRKMSGWLAPQGRLIVTVANSRSLHRRIGSLLGMENHPTDSNTRDQQVGNLRQYDRYKLRQELLAAGLTPIELRGCFLKPLSSTQIAGWSDALLEAFLEMGDELEDYAWFLYAICQNASAGGKAI